MQTATGTIRREPMRAVAQVMLIIAVATASVGFGRWIIPAGDSSDDAVSSGPSATGISAAAAIAQHKFDSGMLEDVVFDDAIALPTSTADPSVAARTIAEHKFKSGALEQVLFGDAAVLDTITPPEAISPAATIAQRKFDSGRLEEVLLGTS